MTFKIVFIARFGTRTAPTNEYSINRGRIKYIQSFSYIFFMNKIRFRLL